MKTEKDYRKLVADLRAVEERLAAERNTWAGDIYLTDECIDRENVLDATGVSESADDFYERMYNAAGSAAGFRGEELGCNINELLGYSVY